MAKLTLNTIGSRYGSIDALNANFDAIETALENTLSRDGTLPNNMDDNLDMDSNRIINLADGINNADAVTLRQVNGIVQGASSGIIASLRENFVATAGQTVFNISSFTYNVGSNNLAVYLDGVRQYPGTSYTETDNNTITFSAGLHVGALVMVISNQSVDTANLNAALVHYNPAGTGAVATNVQAKLREWVSVKDFGAVGDGTTDDTAAIQAAINYCTNLSNRKQTLYFPGANAAAVYKITAPLVVNGRLNVVGDGEFSTIIQAFGFTAGQYIFDFNNEAADNVQFGGMRQITLLSNNGLPNGIRMRNTSYWTLKNVQLRGLTTGIYITGTICFSNFFEQVTGYSISAFTVQFENFTGGGQYMFSGCTFTGSDSVYVTSTAATDTLAFYDCNFEQCVVTDLLVSGTVRGLTISGCRSEGLNGPVSFLIRPEAGKFVEGLSITGCFWIADAGNAYPVSIGGSGGAIQGFSITGNTANYIGFLGFVSLNGAGVAGVISGNYCDSSPTDKIVSVPRTGVVSFSNYNSSGPMTNYNGLIVEGRAAAAPTTGTYAVGSIIYNTAPASAGYVGFVCTVAGTPGTWKTFGLIS